MFQLDPVEKALTELRPRFADPLDLTQRVLLLRRMHGSLKLLTGAMLLLCGELASAQSNGVQSLLQRLKESSDFRVRTQAALALGAAADRRAVAGLCNGLGDSNTTVRAASAAALGRLSLGGQDCLKRRLRGETSSDVKSVIRRALDRLGDPEQKITPSARYYVAIGDPTNRTTRSDSQLSQTVRKALEKHFSQLPGFVVAPESETLAQAKTLLKGHPTVKALFVLPKISAIYRGGSLKLTMDLTLFTYPDKSLVGTMTRNLTMPDTQPGDRASEDELIEMHAERFAPDLAKTAAKI